MQRVHLEALRPAVEPAHLTIELAPLAWYLQAKTPTVPSPPSWRAGMDLEAPDRPDDRGDDRGNAAPGQPLGSFVIELDLT